jgi:chemotaxis signal transduction protein
MALPLTDVRETGQLAAVAPLPNLPGWILHRRGEILSVVDLACFLGLPASQWTGPGQPYLLFRQSDLACCLAVARAGVVVHPEDREFAAPEARPSGPARLTALISGVCRSAGRDILLLDSERLATALQWNNPPPGPERRAETGVPRGEGQ